MELFFVIEYTRNRMIGRSRHVKLNIRRHKSQSGQAITELAVCLIAIMSVVLGFMLVSALSIESVRNALTARAKADANAVSGVLSSDQGTHIIDWNYGADNIPFTQDDIPNTTFMSDGDYFAEQMIAMDEKTGLTFTPSDTSISSDNNFTSDLSSVNLFLFAADLSAGKGVQNDPLKERGLVDMEKAIRNLFGVWDFRLEDTAYIPARAEIESNQF